MIKLAVHCKNNHIEEFVFDKPSVKIGLEGEETDISLPEESLHPCHVEIYEQNGRFYIFNHANDPFVALNDFPFRKKGLKDKAVLFIGKTQIDVEVSPQKMEPTPIREENLALVPFSKPETKEIDVAALVQEVEARGSPPIEKNQPEQSKEISLGNSVIEDEDSASDLHTPQEQESGLNHQYALHERPVRNSEGKNPPSQRSWGFMLSLGTIIVAFITLLVGTAYLKISSESDRDEIKAAEAVADAGMALTYAQVSHLKPQKSNWSQPEFLKTSLASILPPNSRPLIDVDAQGKFNNCPYLLRIYTSGDLSHFLIIAQPAPSTWQWLLPRAAIILDSASMEMRKTTDLKNLNRLLVNINSLDELNPNEISNAVKEGKLIPLASLKLSKKIREFTPPKALSVVRPGAENYIYNAPRYHLLGETIIDKAIALLESPSNDQQVSTLQQDVDMLKKLPNLVLYTTKGIDGALQAEKALSIFVPKTRFLIGYLKINSQGNIINNHMLMSEEISPKENGDYSQVVNESSDKTIEEHEDLSSAEEIAEETPSHLYSNPLYLQLDKLFNDRKSALTPIHTRMEDLIAKEHNGTVNDFHTQFQELLKEHHEISEEQKNIFGENFFKLSEEYRSVPLKEVVEYVQVVGLMPLVESILKERSKENQLSQAEFDSTIEKIRSAANLEELHSEIKKITPKLSLSVSPSIQQLIEYQNACKNEVVLIIEKFLLSPDEKLTTLSPTSKDILENIFELIWVNSPTEREFYFHELDLLLKPFEEATSEIEEAVSATEETLN
ncbi:putative uncharacterized protein [Parachlamydia acanthamoebae UV-7]|uniref:FHA domain-containing protein n=2 Tax=Parachlamydia acanthamoebae TaxID=83552 RepID=F8L1N6_PARAV|nr:FHA domain-containing protein [Parachlamydia acanthamoebae]CCB87186.1 putative uncharacterized protein [Parachlamydia acanthamoebae UV-7]